MTADETPNCPDISGTTEPIPESPNPITMRARKNGIKNAFLDNLFQPPRHNGQVILSSILEIHQDTSLRRKMKRFKT